VFSLRYGLNFKYYLDELRLQREQLARFEVLVVIQKQKCQDGCHTRQLDFEALLCLPDHPANRRSVSQAEFKLIKRHVEVFQTESSRPSFR
jgi:hypothetical protein